MLGMIKDSSLSFPYEKEKEINETILRITFTENSQKAIIKSRPQTTKPLLSRSNTSKAMIKRLGIHTNSMVTMEHKPSNQTVNISRNNSILSVYQTEEKPDTYAINFSLRDTVINTVLLKLDSQLVKFSQVEFNKKHKEVLELQKTYNKLRELGRSKEKEIQLVETQISQLQAKYREKEEVIQKFNSLQYQTNKNLEKLVLTQSEGEYLVKIYHCCEENQPFSQE